jgi:molybdenum cofactor synthesis domain-containing protein
MAAGVERAFVLTVSDRSSQGLRPDTSGDRLAARLADLGFAADRGIVPDEQPAIAAAVLKAAAGHRVVAVTGGTGLTPRDVTPQAIMPLLDYQVPGLGELMRAEGLRHTPFAALSRSFGGVIGATLVLVLPGSPGGAVESLDAVAAILPHALESLAGTAGHGTSGGVP